MDGFRKLRTPVMIVMGLIMGAPMLMAAYQAIKNLLS